MNFSNTKKIRRIISLITVLILMSALFAGCKKDNEQPETTEDTSLNLNLDLDTETQPPETQTEPTETEPVVNEKSATVISRLNVRSSPSSEARVVGSLEAGDKVTVERREEVTGIIWAYISEPTNGWICMDFVEMDIPDAGNDNTSTPAATDPANDDDNGNENNQDTNTTNIKGVVTATGGLMIRSEASTNGDVKGMYNKGDVVSILETKNGWGRTNKGWIKLQYVNTTGNTTANNNTTTNNNNTTNNTTTNITSNGNTTVILKGVVKVKELNIRSSGSTAGDRLGSYNYGARVEILEKSAGWGRTEKGWISLDYVYQDGTTGTNTASGTITATELRVRSGPGTGYGVVASYVEGDRVGILEQFTYNGTTWGCTNKGWISMDYVDVDGGTTNTNTNTNITGTVTTDGLRIRSGAGTDYDVVGSLNKGDRVTIISQKTVGGTVWCQINSGWISMDFVTTD